LFCFHIFSDVTLVEILQYRTNSVGSSRIYKHMPPAIYIIITTATTTTTTTTTSAAATTTTITVYMCVV